MYISYYDLAELPFQNTTDQRFLWFGEKHREALAALQYGIIENKGFVLLTGDVGTGKTTLINALLQDIGDGTLVASLSHLGVDKIGFLRLIWRLFKIPGNPTSLEEYFILFEKYLRKAHKDGKRVLLIVDEAQKLTEEILEQIRVLSNIELPETKLINIVLAGQDELYEKLQKYSCRALWQRINIHYRLNTLSENETVQYVRHRLKVAGLEKEIFDEKALRLVHRFSKGYPRLINRICDHAMLTGFVRQAPTITPELIKESCREILFPSELINDSSVLFRNLRQFFRRWFRKDYNRVSEASEAVKDGIANEGFVAEINGREGSDSKIAKALKSGNLAKNKPAETSVFATDGETQSESSLGRFFVRRRKRSSQAIFALFLLAIISGILSLLSHARFDNLEKGTISRRSTEIAAVSVGNDKPEKSQTEGGSNLPGLASFMPVSSKTGINNEDLSSKDVDFRTEKAQKPKALNPPQQFEPQQKTMHVKKRVFPPPKPERFVHRVQWKGEILTYISNWYTGSPDNWKAIAAANPELHPNRIYINDEIIIPEKLLRTRKPMPRAYLMSLLK